jgi:hypothetical protein
MSGVREGYDMRGVIAIVFLAVAIASSARAEDPLDAEIMRRIESTPRHRLHDETARTEFVRDVYAVSAAHDVPARVILMTSFFESSWIVTARGGLGEIGLMQVHGIAAEGCDLRTQRGQLDCGAKALRNALDACGTLRGALTMYATGGCRTRSDRVKRLIEYRISTMGE